MRRWREHFRGLPIGGIGRQLLMGIGPSAVKTEGNLDMGGKDE